MDNKLIYDKLRLKSGFNFVKLEFSEVINLTLQL